MNTLVPTPDAIPAAWKYFRFLLLFIFPLHLLIMNAMLGATAIALYASMKKDAIRKKLAHELAKVIPFLVAFAVNFGVAALLFLQVLYGTFFYTSSILMGVYWIAVIPLLILAYGALYMFDFKFTSLVRSGAGMAAFALLSFLCIAFIFTNNMTLMLDPQKWTAYFGNSSGTILNLDDPMLIPRYVHIIIGAMAVGGVFVAIFGKTSRRMEPTVRTAAENMGINLFTAMTLLQLLVGLWFLLSLPVTVQRLFMGGDPYMTMLPMGGALLAMLALAAGAKRQVYPCAGLVIPLIYVMSAMRDIVRTGCLKAHFSPGSLEVIPQYSPMVLFFMTLAAGLGTVLWLVKKAKNSFQQTGGRD